MQSDTALLYQCINNIKHILERDSKVASYKFALLRGVVEIIEEGSPFLEIGKDLVMIPIGLMVERWLLYYYPLLKEGAAVPQISQSSQLAFAAKFQPVLEFYEQRGGLSAFNNDLKRKGIPEPVFKSFVDLVRVMRRTIVDQPMKYIGYSVNKDHYTIFQKETSGSFRPKESVNSQIIIESCGTFSIPLPYYHSFRLFGSFISGTDSVLFKWANFSSSISDGKIPIQEVLSKMLQSPVTDRDVRESKKLYRDMLVQNKTVPCVWTGKKISKYDVDHIIPFSIWKNNDLWNLLPSGSTINNQKRDKIPSPKLIEKQKDIILEYWETIYQRHPQRFERELKLSLLGNASLENWKEIGIQQLKKSCDYLIKTRGFEEWTI